VAGPRTLAWHIPSSRFCQGEKIRVKFDKISVQFNRCVPIGVNPDHFQLRWGEGCMTTDRNKVYLLLAFILWITAYISSFAIQGGTPLGPLLYILGSVLFLLTQRPQEIASQQVPSPAEESDEITAEDEELDS
jgi:hypothetical protein